MQYYIIIFFDYNFYHFQFNIFYFTFMLIKNEPILDNALKTIFLSLSLINFFLIYVK